jgi:glycosyltransferase involved in cell wall biosynthesis
VWLGLVQRLFPRAFRFRVRTLIAAAGAVPQVAALRLGPRAARGEPRVSYGLSSRRGGLLHGGRVKLQHLQAAFPSTPSGFNILYMVSSAPPPGASMMARAARERGARIVWNQDGVAYPAFYGAGFDVPNRPMARLLHEADHVFYQSAFCRLAADRYLGPRAGASEILHNTVDTGLFIPAPRARDAAAPVLVLAGTHGHWYRVRTALETLAHLRRARPKARLLVAGPLAWGARSAAALDEVHRHARSLAVEDAIELTGPFSQGEAPSLLGRGDLFLHTQYNDACPTVVLEAMACGLPVVYGRTGGVPELVGEDAGIGVSGETSWDREIPPDPEALAAAADRVLGDLPAFSAAARRRAVERFDVRPWVARHREIFERLLA